MKILALGGAGYMGNDVVRQLVNRSTHEIVIGARRMDKAEKIASELGKKVSAKPINVNDFNSLVNLMKEANITVSTIGPYYELGTKILKAAIAAKTNLVDICDDYNATIDMLNLNGEAEKAGITAIIGAGASPGLTNMFARWCVDKLEKIDEIHTLWCESAVDPTGPAAVRHWLNAVHGQVPTYRDGKMVNVQAFSEPEIVSFAPPINEIELRHVGHPEPVTLPQYIKGVKIVTNKGAIYPAFMNRLYEIFSAIGFGHTKGFAVNEQLTMPLRDLSTKLIRAMPHFAPELFQNLLQEEKEKYEGVGSAFKTVVKGENRGEKVEYSYEVVSTTTPLVTAIPAAIITLMVLDNKIKRKGVHAPEGVVDPEIFFKEFQGSMTIWEKKVQIRKI